MQPSLATDNDDLPVGRILSRREVLGLFGAAGLALLTGCATTTAEPSAPSTTSAAGARSPASPSPAASAPTAASAAPTTAALATLPSCIVRPEVTEGPYFVDERLDRADIRADPSTGAVKPGLPLALTFSVAQVDGAGCTPLAGAMVDVWHCDAAGVYSDVADRSFNTQGQQFLRGYQRTDSSGLATFTTIYPGWYPGRTVHIHFKIRAQNAAGQSVEFTSQLFFDDSLSDAVFTQAPYAAKGQRSTLNGNDGIYRPELLVSATPQQQGYAVRFDVGLQI